MYHGPSSLPEVDVVVVVDCVVETVGVVGSTVLLAVDGAQYSLNIRSDFNIYIAYVFLLLRQGNKMLGYRSRLYEEGRARCSDLSSGLRLWGKW